MASFAAICIIASAFSRCARRLCAKSATTVFCFSIIIASEWRRNFAPTPVALAADAREVWRGYRFAGNVRELKNIVARLTVKRPGETVSAATLIEEIDPANAGLDAAAADGAPPWRAFIESQIDNDDFDLAAAWRRLESIFARAAARREGGDVARAARLLGLDEARLRAATERDE